MWFLHRRLVYPASFTIDNGKGNIVRLYHKWNKDKGDTYYEIEQSKKNNYDQLNGGLSINPRNSLRQYGEHHY